MTRGNKTEGRQKRLSKASESPVAIAPRKEAKSQTAKVQLEKLADMVGDVVRDLRDRAVKQREDGTQELAADSGKPAIKIW